MSASVIVALGAGNADRADERPEADRSQAALILCAVRL
jgi:hypothetical protein